MTPVPRFLALFLVFLIFGGVTAADAAMHAGPGVLARNHRLGGGSGVMTGNGVQAALDFNFAAGRYFPQGAPITVVRASSKSCDDTAGNFTTVGSNLPCITNKGALIEEARTNSVRNNSMQGAVPGTPGTLPTNWSIGGVPVGVTSTVNSIGTLGGVDVISITFSGTNTSGGTAFINLSFETSTTIAALQSQVWAPSLFIQTSGSNPSIWGMRVIEFSNTGVFLTQSASLNGAASFPAFQRITNAYTLTNATTAFVAGALAMANGLPNGSPISQTIIIGWPQLELGSFVTSPIRTTNAAVTRAADVVTVTTPPSFGSAYTLFAQGTPNAPVTYATPQTGVSVDDGTVNNRSQIFRAPATGLCSVLGSTGGSIFLNASTVSVWNTSLKMAAAFAASDQAAVSAGGAPVTNATGTPFIGTQVHIGVLGVGTQQWDGYIERIALWPTTRLPNATLQSLTQ